MSLTVREFAASQLPLCGVQVIHNKTDAPAAITRICKTRPLILNFHMPTRQSKTGQSSPRPPQVLRVLAIPGFARLLASQALFDIGAVARTVAQSWVIYDLTGANLWVGIVSGMRSIPILIFPIFAGAIADRFDKRKLLAFVRIGLAIVSIVQASLIALDIIEPWHMLALALAAGTVVAFAMPAFWAYIADIVAPRMLPRATAFIMMGDNAGEMVGPVMVGWIIATAGADWTYGIIAGIYLLGAIFILNSPKGRYAAAETEAEDKPTYYESVKQGIAYARKSPILPWLFIMNASVNVTGVAIFPLMPEYATKILDVGPVGFGVMSAALGIGLAIGSVIIAITGLPRRVMPIIIVSSFIWDFGMIGFGFSRIYPLTLALLFIMGIAGMFWVNAIINLYQREAIGEMRGRVMSLYAIGVGLFPLGWTFGGTLSALIGNEPTLIVSALGGTPLVLLAMLLAPGLRRS